MDELPDEVLVHIFYYLRTADLLNVSKVSDRFNRLCCEKRVISKLDFRHCYSMNGETLKIFLSVKLRCLKITELNFNGCWWLTYTQLKPISKLKNLKTLHLLQSRVTWDLLPQLISGLYLETFSWTWTEKNGLTLFPSEFLKIIKLSFAEMKNLYIEVSNPFHLTYVWFILSYTPKLEIFELNEVALGLHNVRNAIQNLKSWTGITEILTCNLSSLRECKIFLRSSAGYTVKDFISRIFVASFAKNTNVYGFWASEAGCKSIMELNGNYDVTVKQIQDAKFLSLSGRHARFLNPPNSSSNQLAFAKTVLSYGLPNCKCLSLDRQRIDGELLDLLSNGCPQLECLSLMNSFTDTMPLGPFTKAMESCSNMSELNLINTHFHISENPFEAIAKLKNLKILSLSTCALGTNNTADETEDTQQNNLLFGVKQRKGLPSRPTDCDIQDSRLYPVAQSCIKISNLIIRTEECSYGSCENLIASVTDSSLFCISKMKNLVSLELGEMSRIRHGQFLPEICQNCKLENLRLIEIGPKSQMVYHNSLVSALNLCKELKHLKLEQKYGIRLLGLQQSLLKCINLEKLEIISEGGQHLRLYQQQHPIIDVVNKLSNLVYLHLIQPTSKEDCMKTKKHLEQMLKDSRPGFRCEVACSRNGNIIKEIRKFPLYFQK